jgi:DDE superfamily endonuclease
MPLHVPASLDALLSLLRGAFTQPTFQTFRALVVGFVSRVGEHTVTGMLIGARLGGVWHHSRAHDFFARAAWCPDALGVRLVDFIVAVLCPAGAPILVAVDDTLFGRSGRKVADCFYHHDGSQPPGQGMRTRWGHNWVVLGIVVELPFRAGRPVCLPVLFRLWRPRRPEHPDRPSKGELARELIIVIARRLAGRTVHVVADAAYASRALRGLPAHVTVTVRMRANAAVQGPQPPRTGKRGRPRQQGERLGTLAELAAADGFGETTVAGRSALAKTIIGQWYAVFGAQSVQIVLARRPDSPKPYDIALVSTDLEATAGQLLERYRARWTIETCFQDAKQTSGVGQARNRAPRAVARTVPFGFLCHTLAQLWYALHGQHAHDVAARRATAPWHHAKQAASTQDVLAALRRAIIRAQFPAQAPAGRTPRQITPTAKRPAIGVG